MEYIVGSANTALMGYFSNDKLYTAAVRMARKIQYDSNHLITSLPDGWSLSCYDDVIAFSGTWL